MGQKACNPTKGGGVLAGNVNTSERLRSLRQHARRLGPFEALSGSEFLRRLYVAAKKALGRYSYRYYAEDFGFGPTNYLHLICKGTRPLTVSAAERIADALDFKERERRYFVLLARYESSRSTLEREVFFEEIVETRARSFGFAHSPEPCSPRRLDRALAAGRGAHQPTRRRPRTRHCPLPSEDGGARERVCHSRAFSTARRHSPHRSHDTCSL